MIKKLDTVLCNLIAAGEVVERPLSIVKELVENAVDANSTEITINLIESGLSLIRVIDNGLGMSHEDALISFRRHTTSKIESKNDLFSINTLGFRGEALASICSISKMTIETSDGVDYTKLNIKAGVLGKVESTSMNKGTIISVENMFFNTPARLQFIKSLRLELTLITRYLQKLAVCYPAIRFNLTNNQKSIFITSGSDSRLKTFSEIYSIDVTKSMNYLKFNNYDYQVEAYFSNPSFTKSNRYEMNVIVNNRVVNDYKINKAVIEAYGLKLFSNRYPYATIIISCDPLLIDVNIHPSKQEIKLTDINKLLLIIKENIHNYLFNVVNSDYSVKNETSTTVSQARILEANYVTEEENAFSQDNNSSKNSYYDKAYLEQDSIDALNYKEDTIIAVEALKDVDSEKPFEEFNQIQDEGLQLQKHFPKLRFIGEVMKTFFICEGDGGMYIIDKHAAAERVNFEYYTEMFKKEKMLYYDLLVGIILEYSPSEVINILDHVEEIKNYGINLEQLSTKSFIVRKIPIYFNRKGLEKEYIEEIIENVLNDTPLMIKKKLAQSLACKKSIKSNYTTTVLEAEALINSLSKCENPYNCAHGRPTIIRYSRFELDKLFLRI